MTFKVFEWQAVVAARVLAGKAQLPPLEEQQRWETDRIAERGDGAGFTLVHPEFEEYFENLRHLDGEPGQNEPGRRLPPFEQKWVDDFHVGHAKRIAMWNRMNENGRGYQL